MRMSTSVFMAAHIIISNQGQIKLHKSLGQGGAGGGGTTVNAEFFRSIFHPKHSEVH